MDQDIVKLGLLLETAQTHQKLAEAAIEKLNKQTQGLDAVVKDQIHRALLEGLKAVHAETQGVVTALKALKHAANARTTFWTLGLTAISVAIPLFVAWWVLPTQPAITALRTERDELASNIAVLDQHGARGDFRRCGKGHLCVRVDVNAPRYGDQRDYFVMRGY